MIIKLDKIKTEDHLSKAIAYIMNEKKTKGLSFSNAGITSNQITETFFQTKKMHPSRGNRQAYHFKFSFSKDETISPENALAFIKDWVNEYLGEDYDYVFSVHQDREHMHMHLVFNSVRREGGKFHYEKRDWNNIIKPLSNRLAEKYNTGPLKDKDPKLDYSTDYEKKVEGFSGIEKVQSDMDKCIAMSKSYGDFKGEMVQLFHYQLREGVSKEHGLYLSLTPPGKAKAIRTYRLAPGYMPAEIEGRIDGTYVMQERKQQSQKSYKPKGLGWATSRNYTFIPYKELSDFQKQRVRKTLDARRMYQRTGTSLQMHEQSVRAIRTMTEECKKYGTVWKRKRSGHQIQRELEKKTKKQRGEQRYRKQQSNYFKR